MDFKLLCERIRNGNQDAAAELHAKVAPKLLAYVKQRLGLKLQSRVDPEDIVQETMVDVLAFIRKGEADIRHVEHLSRTIARHAMYRLSMRRSVSFNRLDPGEGEEGTKRTLEPASAGPGPGTIFLRGERERLLDAAIASLKPEQAEIVRLRLGGGEKRTFKEIGAIAGISPEAAERAYLRAKEKLLRYLKAKSKPGTDPESWI